MSRIAPHHHSLLFLDFETGGLSPTTADVVEVACILTDPSGRDVREEYVAKVVPTRPVDPQAAAINGYSAEKWASEAIPFEQALVKVLGMARNTMLACHNTPFDKAFLDAGLVKHKMRWPGSYHSIDTVSLSMPLLRMGLVENVKLVTLTAALGIAHEGAHTALADVRACRELYLRLMAVYGPGLAQLLAPSASPATHESTT